MSANIVSDALKISDTTIPLDTTTLTINAPAANRSIVLPDPGSSGNVILNTSGPLVIENDGTVGSLLTKSTTSVAIWDNSNGALNTNPYGLGTTVSSAGIYLGGSGTPIYLIRLYVSGVATRYYFMLTN